MPGKCGLNPACEHFVMNSATAYATHLKYIPLLHADKSAMADKYKTKYAHHIHSLCCMCTLEIAFLKKKSLKDALHSGGDWCRGVYE